MEHRFYAKIVTHIVLCFCFVFLRLVYLMLPVSLEFCLLSLRYSLNVYFRWVPLIILMIAARLIQSSNNLNYELLQIT
jgi:hypothetical protein